MQKRQPSTISKVSIFVIDADDRLLVFEHPDSPAAGIQVPAGTLELNEQPLAGAFRELCEETGKSSFQITRLLDRREIHEVRQGRAELHDRWFYQAVTTQTLPEEWIAGDWTTTGWEPFHFYWISRAEAERVFTPDHAQVYRLTSPQID